MRSIQGCSCASRTVALSDTLLCSNADSRLLSVPEGFLSPRLPPRLPPTSLDENASSCCIRGEEADLTGGAFPPPPLRTIPALPAILPKFPCCSCRFVSPPPPPAPPPPPPALPPPPPPPPPPPLTLPLPLAPPLLPAPAPASKEDATEDSATVDETEDNIPPQTDFFSGFSFSFSWPFPFPFPNGVASAGDALSDAGGLSEARLLPPPSGLRNHSWSRGTVRVGVLRGGVDKTSADRSPTPPPPPPPPLLTPSPTPAPPRDDLPYPVSLYRGWLSDSRPGAEGKSESSRPRLGGNLPLTGNGEEEAEDAEDAFPAAPLDEALFLLFLLIWPPPPPPPPGPPPN